MHKSFNFSARPRPNRGFTFAELAGLIALVTFLAARTGSAAAPYPWSTYITNVTFNLNTARTYCKKVGTDGGDIWCYTWGADDSVYTAYGDGYGFNGPNKVSWGISKMAGPFQSFTNTDIYFGPLGSKHGKIGSLLAISNATMNVIYAMDNIQDAGGGESTNTVLMSSTDNGVLWKTNVNFSHLSEFHGGFVQCGQGYSGNTDGYVYFYGGVGQRIGTYMARVPIGSVPDKTQYRYLTNIDAGNQAHWGYLSNAISIFDDPNGWPDGADYDTPLGRWLFGGAPYPGDGGCLSLFEGPTMWGPWKTIVYTTNWANLGNYPNGFVEDFGFPQKYMSADGTSLGMFASVYLTTNTSWNDTLLTMTVTLSVATGSNSPPTAPTGLVAIPASAYPSMQVDLTWNNVTNATSYQVQRSTTNGGPYTSLAYTAAGGTNYTDTAVRPGTAYYYVVTAANSGGQSTNSVQAAVTTRTNAAPTLNPIASLTTNMNALTQTINLAGIGPGPNEAGQTLTVTASSGNTSLIPNPTVNYASPNPTGTLSFTPVANASGTTFVTVKVQDSGGTNGGGVDTLTQTFAVSLISGGPSVHDYRSVASGNWNAVTTWQTYNGSSWVAATAPPNSASGLITIQSPHQVTNSTSVTVAHVVVNAGAQLIVNAGTVFTVVSGSGTNLEVFGVVNNAGTVAGAGMVLFEPGGQYLHRQDGGTILTANWSTDSTCLITGITNSTSLGGLGQAFYNFGWNCPNQSVRFDAGGSLTYIRGNLSVTAAASTNPSTVGGHGLALSLGTGQTLTIGGDLNLTNVYLIPAGNVATQGSGVQIILGGNIRTDGKYTAFYTDYSGNNRQLFGVICFTNLASETRISQGPNANVPWDGCEAYSYQLAAGANLDVGTNGACIWNFTNLPGSTLAVGNVAGIETIDDQGAFQAQEEYWKGGALALQFPVPATNYFEPNATYVYNGSIAQVTGGGLPVTVANLTINNPTVVSIGSHSGDAPYPLTPAGLKAVTKMLSVLNGTLDLSGTNAPTVGGLSGFGAITNGNMTLANSGPGLIPGGVGVGGMLTLDGTLTFGADTRSTFDLSDDPDNGVNDEVVLIRGGTVAGNGSVITIHPMATLSQIDYVLLDVQGTGRVATDFNPLPAWSGMRPADAANYRVVTVNNQVLLRYTSVPEPLFVRWVLVDGSLMMAGGGGGLPAAATGC
jgi:hypothetical protein